MTKFYCDRHWQVLGVMKEIPKPRYLFKDLTDPRKELLLCDECVSAFIVWFYNKTVMEKNQQANIQSFLQNLDTLKFEKPKTLEDPPPEADGKGAIT